MIVRFDTETEKWFAQHGQGEETTVCECEACGLFYKPSLGHKCKAKPKKELAQRDEQTEAADVVAVVRCKDCEYNVANMERDPLDATDYTDIVCSYFMTDGMEPTDFCSRGKRKEA